MKPGKALNELIVGLKGAGEMASAVAWRLYQARIRQLFMMEIPRPLAVRREVSFCEALHEGLKTVEGVEAVRAAGVKEIARAWEQTQIPVIVDPRWETIDEMGPDVVVDAILAKRNLGTTMREASLVIGLGPGFTAGQDVHMVIETNRGHNLGRVILSGQAESNTGVPGEILGSSAERVLRAPSNGLFRSFPQIGDQVEPDEIVGDVNGNEVRARIGGVIRGLIASGVQVNRGLKIGDIDPRGDVSYCGTISDKARAIGGGVLEAILRVFNES
ncbi:MAG: EF2563 family selenium-dependent molybdenum hydroxylase system protein [Deltaproteobacteria bacterium]|nr:EF2563 family selenium-dependent molybdenum hydroxylase system protein [Deltaproteobacteria bacterium]